MSNRHVDAGLPTAAQAEEAVHNVVQPSRFTGWEQYPEGLPSFSPFACDATIVRNRLIDQSSLLFAPSSDPTCHVRISDLNASNNLLVSKDFLQQSKVEQYIGGSVEPDLRIICIPRPDSLSQLRISRELLQKLLHFHQIGPCFVDLISTFKAGDDLSEKGHSLWAPPTESGVNSEICYTLRYMANKGSQHAPNWTERQLGVYHRYGGDQKAVMVLLQTGLNTDLETRMSNILKTEKYARDSLNHPLNLHLVILSTYLDNWRSFLQAPGHCCKSKEDKYMTTQLDEMNSSLDFDELQELRHFQSKLIVADAILKATSDIIHAVKSVAESAITSASPVLDPQTQTQTNGHRPSDPMPDLPAGLESLRLKCSNYSKSAAVLQLRIQSLMRLLSDGLNIQNQQSSSEIAGLTYTLTKKSVDDNAIVRVITVITLIYLPLQGVATFFGMNLTFAAEDNTMRFTDNWWLFIECAIPITVVTLAILVAAILWEREEKKKESRRGPPTKQLVGVKVG